MIVFGHRLLWGIAACLIVLPAAAQRATPDATPPAQTDQKTTDQKDAKPDPGGQVLWNVFKLIEAEKARADAKRKADAERAKQDAAKQDAATAQTPPTETPKTVPVETKTPVVDTARKTPLARKVPLRPLKPLLPRPDLSPGPLPRPKPDALSPPAEPVPGPSVATVQPAPAPPPVVRPVSPNAPESSRWSGILIDLVLLTLVVVGALAVRRWFFAVPPPLPGAKAHADPGTVSAPLFADDPPLPQVSFLVASGSFTSQAEYPQGAS